jgi:hypothetical protein
MFQPSSEATPETIPHEDSAATEFDVDGVLARQNAELDQALEWLREQGAGVLPFDDELSEQVAELDRITAEVHATRPLALPELSTRC